MTPKGDLLIELFSEEIPARMQWKAAEDLKTLFKKQFSEVSLTYDRLESFITPRRLSLAVQGLDLSQPSLTSERKGPRIDAPEKAIQGFLSSTGLRLDQCEERVLEKGTFYFATIQTKSQLTESLLPKIVQNVVDTFPWPKSMRWGHSQKSWVRPLQRGICLLDGKTLSFQISFGNGESVDFSNFTQGHRFMAPQSIEVRDFKEYQQALKDNFVILDHGERKAFIAQKAKEMAASKGLTIRSDDPLLEEVTGLVEWPCLLMGSINENFMSLPPELLVTVMKSHQKYFALENSEGKLAPYFLIVANLQASDGGQAIIQGNARVLKARFSDAAFFYDLDQKQSLESHGKKLDTLIFHKDLGSMAEKVQRMSALSSFIGEKMETNVSLCQRAALLCKADLTTEMVGEFPELQGIMGRYYAQWEGSQISQAIQEHYGPRGAHDPVPEGAVSQVVSMADKVDTLVGFFGIGIQPTGSKDPYALRRSALGLIRLVETSFKVQLRGLFERAFDLYGQRLSQSKETLLKNLESFIIDRVKVYWKVQGIPYDTLNAVLSKAVEDPLCLLKKRALALEAFLQKPEGDPLLGAYKRASNMVRIEEEKNQCVYNTPIDETLLREPPEKDLFLALKKGSEAMKHCLLSENFQSAMEELCQLKTSVDTFFDQVTVNDEDHHVRINRLNLLSHMRSTFDQVADFSKIERH